jgi:hypothetical protein
VTLQNAYLIKGYLLDKTPPTEVVAALNAVISTLGHAENMTGSTQGIAQSRKAVTGHALAHISDDMPSLHKSADDPPKRTGWSPEARAAQAERMKARHAARNGVSPGESAALSEAKGGAKANRT